MSQPAKISSSSDEVPSASGAHKSLLLLPVTGVSRCYADRPSDVRSYAKQARTWTTDSGALAAVHARAAHKGRIRPPGPKVGNRLRPIFAPFTTHPLRHYHVLPDRYSGIFSGRRHFGPTCGPIYIRRSNEAFLDFLSRDLARRVANAPRSHANQSPVWRRKAVGRLTPQSRFCWATPGCPEAVIGSLCTSEPYIPAFVCSDRRCAGLGIFRAHAHHYRNVSARGRWRGLPRRTLAPHDSYHHRELDCRHRLLPQSASCLADYSWRRTVSRVQLLCRLQDVALRARGMTPDRLASVRNFALRSESRLSAHHPISDVPGEAAATTCRSALGRKSACPLTPQTRTFGIANHASRKLPFRGSQDFGAARRSPLSCPCSRGLLIDRKSQARTRH